MADVATTIARWDRLRADRASWEDLWQTLADYLLPRKSSITTQRAPGEKQTQRLYDSTGVHAAELLAASMHGALTSPAQKWFGLRMRQEELNDVQAVQDWLEEVAERTYLALNQSNFASEIHEVYLDMAVFGTGALLLDERQPPRAATWGGLQCRALSVGEYAVDENAEGRVDVLYRTFQLSARAAVAQWPTSHGDKLAELARSRPEQLVTLLHALEPRRDGDGTPRAARAKPVQSCTVVLDFAHELAERGYEEFPVLVARWTKASRERYGRGPGYTALPDVRTLNRAVELKLSAWAKAIDPPLLQRHEAVLGSLSLEPAAINVVEELDAVRPLESAARFDVTAIQEAELRAAIRRIFFADQLQLQERPQMTATEVQVRYELMQRLLGPTLGRLQAELLSPLIERAVNLLARAGQLPPAPGVLAQGGDIDIEYEGPLARAQRSTDLIAIERKNAWLTTVLPIRPEVADVFDWDAEARHVASVTGVPADILEDEQAVAQVRQGRQQQQAALAQMQALQTAAETASKAAPLAKMMQDEAAMAGAAA